MEYDLEKSSFEGSDKLNVSFILYYFCYFYYLRYFLCIVRYIQKLNLFIICLNKIYSLFTDKIKELEHELKTLKKNNMQTVTKKGGKKKEKKIISTDVDTAKPSISKYKRKYKT